MSRTLALAGLVGAIVACQVPVRTSPYDVPSESERATTVAEKLSREGADLIATDPSKAEALLRDALTKDLYYGPAHNNLGVVFLNEGKLYEAAHEFEWARKLLPGNPDPRVNLALTLERAGRTDEAFKSYETALEVSPEYLPAIEGAASIAIRTGREEPRLPDWLRTLALGTEDPAWQRWALEHSARPR